MNKLLIDGDIVVYAMGFSADKDMLPWQDTKAKVYEFLESIKEGSGVSESQIYLTGVGGNYREEIYPDYKGNRDADNKPVWYSEIREYLSTTLGAITADGMEADDAMGLAQTENTVIATIDKDLRTVPGWHYNWNKVNEGLVHVEPLDAFRTFCIQCLTGDSTDNIPGMFKIMGKKAMPKIKRPLFDLKNKEEMWDYVEDIYKDHLKDLEMIVPLLWIRHTYRVWD